jgi:hypothetical protein
MKLYSVSHWFGNEDMGIDLKFVGAYEVADYMRLFFMGLDGDSSLAAWSLTVGFYDPAEENGDKSGG